jgi:hypothetical protein
MDLFLLFTAQERRAVIRWIPENTPGNGKRVRCNNLQDLLTEIRNG